MKSFREHAPMCRLLAKIPMRIHLGLMASDLNLTAIAANPSFIALGTNSGLVYWYDRARDEIEKFWCNDPRTPITKLALVETVDYMLAVGNATGCVTVFQIPRKVDPSIQINILSSEYQRPQMQESSESFNISDSHSKAITALEWSQNGMRLFSGDQEGKVVLTSFDFSAKTAIPKPLLVEDGGICQLSYCKTRLLVSTTERHVMIHISSDSVSPVSNVLIVGRNPRKQLGEFGGVFKLPNSNEKDFDFFAVRARNTLFLARPLNQKDEEGYVPVQATILFNSLVSQPHPEVMLINPVIFSSCTESGENDIRMIKPLWTPSIKQASFVGYNKKTFHILQPEVPQVIASCSGLRGILDLSVTSNSSSPFVPNLSRGDEIFILESNRSIVRISEFPDPHGKDYDEFAVKDVNSYQENIEGKGVETVTSGFFHVTESVANSAVSAISQIKGRVNHIFGVYDPVDAIDQGCDALVVAEALEEAGRFDSISSEDDEDIQGFQSSQQASALQEDPDESICQDIGKLRLELRHDDEEPQSDERETQKQNNKRTTAEDSLIKTLKLDYFVGKSSKRSCETEDSHEKDNPTNRSDDNYSELQNYPSRIPEKKEISEPTVEKYRFQDVGWKSWQLSKLPSKAVTSSGNLNNLVICDEDNKVFAATFVSGKTISWRKMNFPARKVLISPNGKQIARIDASRRIFASHDFSSQKDLVFWIELATEVEEFTMSDHSVYLVQDGNENAIRVFSNLLHPFTELSTNIECNFKVQHLTCSNSALLVVASSGYLLARLNVSSKEPLGTVWLQFPSFPITSKICKIETREQLVGTKMIQKVVVLTENGNLFYIHGLLSDLLEKSNLRWLEIDLSNLDDCFNTESPFDISIAEQSIHIFPQNSCSNTVYHNFDAFDGLTWTNIECDFHMKRIRSIDAGGVLEKAGPLWILLQGMKPNKPELFCSTFPFIHALQVEYPRDISLHSVCSSPDTTWALTNCGKILMRKQLSFENGYGTGWTELDLTQLNGVHLTWLSLGSDSAWALDDSGRAWMRLGPLKPEFLSRDSLPIWLPCENQENNEHALVSPHLVKICTSVSCHIVWAIDKNGEVFARQGIFSDYRLGLGWVPVKDEIEPVAEIAASETNVWVLTKSGSLFKRSGISSTNFVGEKWEKVTLKSNENNRFTTLTVTPCDQVFCTDLTGQVFHMTHHRISLSVPKVNEFCNSIEDESDMFRETEAALSFNLK